MKDSFEDDVDEGMIEMRQQPVLPKTEYQQLYSEDLDESIPILKIRNIPIPDRSPSKCL